VAADGVELPVSHRSITTQGGAVAHRVLVVAAGIHIAQQTSAQVVVYRETIKLQKPEMLAGFSLRSDGGW
jgi:hypothetical protein